MQFEQAHSVVGAKPRHRDHRRTGVKRTSWSRLKARTRSTYSLAASGSPPPREAAQYRPHVPRYGLLRRCPAHIAPPAWVSIYQWFALLIVMVEELKQDKVLQHVGMIANVEGVTIAKHRDIR